MKCHSLHLHLLGHTDQQVCCHLKAVWHSVNCIQTLACVWDYSSHTPGSSAELPSQFSYHSNCGSADLGTADMQVPLTD